MRIARLLAIVTILSVAVLMTGCLSGKGNGSSGGSGGNGGSGNASLTSITVQPAQPTVAPGDTKQFTAMGHYSDGSSKNITSSATWTSANSTIATIDGHTGLAVAIASGTVNITASSNGITGTTVMTVANLSNITVAPATASINPNATQQFTATAHYSNGEHKDVTTQATWTSSDTTIATIVQTTGVATGVKAGIVTITATYQGDNATARLTVLGVVSISVTPIGPGVVTTGTQQFKATAKFNDGSQRDVTSAANWSSSNTSVATIINSPNNANNGLATAVAVGQTEISATYQTTFVGSTAMNVTPSPAPFTNANVSGDYVISLTGKDVRGVNFVVGTIHADGNGNITSGTIDSNTVFGVSKAQSVTGTYTVFPDGRGDMHFISSITAGSPFSFRFVLSNGGNSIQVIQFDALTTGLGKIERQSQSCSSFGATDIQGAYAFGEGGITSGVPVTPVAAIGSFTASGSTISAGERDVDNNGTLTTQVSFTGSYTQDSTTACRYVVTLNEGTSTFTFAYYAVSPGSSSGKAYFAEIDATPSPALGGVAEQQTATTISNGNYAFLTSFSGTEGQFQSGGIAGLIGLSGTSVTGGEEDEAPVTSNSPVSITGGSLTAQGTGRYLLSETTSTASNPNFILNVVSGTRFFMLRSDVGASNVSMGAGDAQTSTNVANATYTLRAASLGSTTARADLGLLYIPQGTCPICGIGDRNQGGTTSSLTLSDSSAPSTDGFGRAAVVLGEPVPGASTTYILYVVTPNKFVALGENINSDGYVNVQ